MDRIPEEKGDLVETEEILDALRRKEMPPAKKSMLVEMIQEDLTQITEEEGDLVETERILDTSREDLAKEDEGEGGGSGFERSVWKSRSGRWRFWI